MIRQRLQMRVRTADCYLLCLCCDIHIDGTLEFVLGVIFPLQLLKLCVILTKYLPVISHYAELQLTNFRSFTFLVSWKSSIVLGTKSGSATLPCSKI